MEPKRLFIAMLSLLLLSANNQDTVNLRVVGTLTDTDLLSSKEFLFSNFDSRKVIACRVGENNNKQLIVYDIASSKKETYSFSGRIIYGWLNDRLIVKKPNDDNVKIIETSFSQKQPLGPFCSLQVCNSGELPDEVLNQEIVRMKDILINKDKKCLTIEGPPYYYNTELGSLSKNGIYSSGKNTLIMELKNSGSVSPVVKASFDKIKFATSKFIFNSYTGLKTETVLRGNSGATLFWLPDNLHLIAEYDIYPKDREDSWPIYTVFTIYNYVSKSEIDVLQPSQLRGKICFILAVQLDGDIFIGEFDREKDKYTKIYISHLNWRN